MVENSTGKVSTFNRFQKTNSNQVKLKKKLEWQVSRQKFKIHMIKPSALQEESKERDSIKVDLHQSDWDLLRSKHLLKLNTILPCQFSH